MSEGTITLLDSTDMMLRQINHNLMVQWINQDLLNRCENDVRNSTVLYDADKVFVAALPAHVPESAIWTGTTLLRERGIRFYSRGIV